MLAPPGGSSQTLTLAPPRTVLDSKRVPLMVDQESALDSQLPVLDDGTSRRNREFKRRMDAIQCRQEVWMEKVRQLRGGVAVGWGGAGAATVEGGERMEIERERSA